MEEKTINDISKEEDKIIDFLAKMELYNIGIYDFYDNKLENLEDIEEFDIF